MCLFSYVLSFCFWFLAFIAVFLGEFARELPEFSVGFKWIWFFKFNWNRSLFMFLFSEFLGSNEPGILHSSEPGPLDSIKPFRLDPTEPIPLDSIEPIPLDLIEPGPYCYYYFINFDIYVLDMPRKMS